MRSAQDTQDGAPEGGFADAVAGEEERLPAKCGRLVSLKGGSALVNPSHVAAITAVIAARYAESLVWLTGMHGEDDAILVKGTPAEVAALLGLPVVNPMGGAA